jgi:putative polyhydroxyalkanoate system protein
MSNLTVSLSHQLTRAAARQRVEELIDRLPQEYGSLVSRFDKQWNGDTMTFQMSASGVSISGTVYVEDHLVRVDIPLPWPLSMFASNLQQVLEDEGRKLLTQG